MSKKPETVDLGSGECKDITPKEAKMADKPKFGWFTASNILVALALLVVIGAGVSWLGSLRGDRSDTTKTPLVTTAPSPKEEVKAPTLSPKEKEEAEWKGKVQDTLTDIGNWIKKQEEAKKAPSATDPRQQTEGYGPQGDPRMQQPQGGNDGWQGGRQANGRRRALSPAEIAAQAYESLGPAPSDAPLKNHQKVAKKGSGSFTCPDGSPGIPVKRVEDDGRGMGHARWFCR